MPRRALAGLPLVALIHPVAAQGIPAGPVRVVVPFPPRQSTDILTRLLTEPLAQRWRQPINVVNGNDQGGVGATADGIRAAADGRTLIIGTMNTLAIDPANLSDLPYRVPDDVTPVCGVFTTPFAVVVHPQSDMETLAALLERARREPERLTFTSNGFLTATHMAAALLFQRAGVRLRHRPLRGDTAGIVAVMERQADVTVAIGPVAQPHVLAGRLRALAVTSAVPWPPLADVPPSVGVVPATDVGMWGGLVAPARTPVPLVERIHADVANVLEDRDVRRRYAEYGVSPMPLDPASFALFLRAEQARWREVGMAVRAAPR